MSLVRTAKKGSTEAETATSLRISTRWLTASSIAVAILVSAYLALKQPEKLIPILEQSERDFPKDYNPPSRLSLAYKAMGKYDEALAATERALARAYGPRKIGIYRNRSDIFALKGDKESAKKTLE